MEPAAFLYAARPYLIAAVLAVLGLGGWWVFG